MSNPALSVLIPCYNGGQYLPAALASITSYPDKHLYEIIIVNDGSTDEATIGLLNSLQQQGYQVINQENKGPAAARNNAAKNAKGEYLLLLDSDNKIRHNYIKKGVDILRQNPEISIVHGKPVFFGNVTPSRLFDTGKFDMAKMLNCNYIDNCTLIRKSAWDMLGGQDEKSFVEDWEFWIRAGIADLKFFYLEEDCFDYRIVSDSLTDSLAKERWDSEAQYIYNKHVQLLTEQYKRLYIEKLIYHQDQQQPFRSFVKYFFKKYFKKK
ncbi:glycosyltransferase family 2 protein [Mucilaginibacter calamicampi]|uniref:Glycosyltransferase family 2 protein n=1 Tax=Mucilaginibacter calamicampi TaxID=1302352 RepID=A0ABW2Z1X8_9SPHI